MHLKVVSPEDAVNLSKQLNDGDWMVLYYADWCGHCKNMKPEWQKVVKRFNCPSSRVNVAEVNSEQIGNMIKPPEIAGFPTIKMYNSGREVAEFDEERLANKMMKFAMMNSERKMVPKPAPKFGGPISLPPAHYPAPVQAPSLHKPIRMPFHKKVGTRVTRTHRKHRSHSRQAKPIQVQQKPKTRRSVKVKPVQKQSQKPVTRRSHKASHKKAIGKKSQKSVIGTVFNSLIKSFDRIGAEARKDEKLLKNVRSKV